MSKQLFLALFLLAAAAGCGGSSTGSTPNTSPTATPTPTVAPSSPAGATFPCNTTTASSSGTLSGVTPGTAATYPPLGSCNQSITFQSGTTIAAGTSVNVTTSLAAPAGAPSPLPTAPTGASGSAQTIVFETLTVTSGSITLGTGAAQSPQQTVTLASTGTCTANEYYEAFASGGQWNGGWGNNGTLNGLTVTFPPGQSNAATLNAAGSPYYVAFVCF